MRVVYALSHQIDWIGFAQEMKKRLNWEPVYWLTTNITDIPVKENFPQAVRHSYIDVIKGIGPKEIDLFAPYPLDETTIKDFSFEMDQAIKMMDRLDSGGAFSYNERKRYFLKILGYSFNVIEKLAPQVVVFTEVPHHASQYILYAVCRKRNIHTLMFKPVFIHDLRLLIYNGVDDDPFETLKNSSITLDQTKNIDDDIAVYISRLKSDYSSGMPDYMRQQRKTALHHKAIFKTFFKLIRKESVSDLFSRKRTTNVLKLKGKTIEQSMPNRLQLYWIKFKGSFVKQRLKRIYFSLTKAGADMTRPFVFVPLQYQPERTSSPDAGAYVDQFLMVNLLRAVIPENVSICVKEHTSQFHPKADGHLGRAEFDYYDLSKLPNVYLLPTTVSSFELIDKCLCVATLTGTVGLEAVARHKPVLVFGAGCWYRSLPGVFFTPNVSLLKSAIAKIEQGIEFDDHALFHFFQRFCEISFKGKLTPSFPLSIEPEENVKRFSDAVEKYVNTVWGVQYAH